MHGDELNVPVNRKFRRNVQLAQQKNNLRHVRQKDYGVIYCIILALIGRGT